MNKRWKTTVRVVTWSAALMLLAVAVSELVLFRFIWKPSEIPRVAFERGVLKYAPDQRGVHRVKDEVVATFRINGSGWNSGHAEYVRVRAPARVRIAVIGDSYIEALDVDFDQSLAERLERLLGPDRAEVYRFGSSAVPMSQYLQMLRQEVAAYQPDVVFVFLLRASFENSYRRQQGIYTSSFLKLDLESGTVVGEIEPTPYRKPWYNFIRTESAIWGYWVYRRRLKLTTLRTLFLGPESETKSAAPSDASDLDRPNVDAATQYVLGGLHEVAARHGMQLVVVMDGARRAIYNALDEDALDRSTVRQLSHIARGAADARDIPFIDLHPIFHEDYARHQRRFEFVNDAQWNERGHTVVARALCEYLRDSATFGWDPAPQCAAEGAAGRAERQPINAPPLAKFRR